MEIYTVYILYLPFSSLSFKQKQPNIQHIHTFHSLKKGWRMECYGRMECYDDLTWAQKPQFLYFWPGVFAWMLGGFVGIIAMMWCLFKYLRNHCDGNYQDDAEEVRVPEEVTVNTSRRPPPYSSLFGVKQEDPPPPYSSLFGVEQESNYKHPPPLYPGTQEKTDSG